MRALPGKEGRRGKALPLPSFQRADGETKEESFPISSSSSSSFFFAGFAENPLLLLLLFLFFLSFPPNICAWRFIFFFLPLPPSSLFPPATKINFIFFPSSTAIPRPLLPPPPPRLSPPPPTMHFRAEKRRRPKKKKKPSLLLPFDRHLWHRAISKPGLPFFFPIKAKVEWRRIQKGKNGRTGGERNNTVSPDKKNPAMPFLGKETQRERRGKGKTGGEDINCGTRRRRPPLLYKEEKNAISPSSPLSSPFGVGCRHLRSVPAYYQKKGERRSEEGPPAHSHTPPLPLSQPFLFLLLFPLSSPAKCTNCKAHICNARTPSKEGKKRVERERGLCLSFPFLLSRSMVNGDATCMEGKSSRKGRRRPPPFLTHFLLVPPLFLPLLIPHPDRIGRQPA